MHLQYFSMYLLEMCRLMFNPYRVVTPSFVVGLKSP